MSCFPFRRTAPLAPLPPPPRHRFAALPAAILAELIETLPLRVELTTASGDRFTNRPGQSFEGPAFSARLSDGSNVRCLRSTETDALLDASSRTQSSVALRVAPNVDHLPEVTAAYATLPLSLQPQTPIELFTASLDYIPAQAWALTLSGAEVVAVCVNSRYAEFRGKRSAGALLAPQWRDGVFADDLASSREAWARALSTGGDYTNVCRVRRASDGAFVRLREEGRPFRDASGAVVAFGCVATDVDVLMQRNASLQVEHQLLTAVIDQLPIGAYVMSASLGGGVTLSNRKMREIWGSPPESVHEQYKSGEFSFCSAQYKHGDGRLYTRAELPGVRAFSLGEIVLGEEMQLFAAGQPMRTVSISAVPVCGPDGVILGAAGIAEDVSAKRAQEAERHRLRAQADFLAMMNHELRIHGILGLAELLMRTFPAGDAPGDASPFSQSGYSVPCAAVAGDNDTDSVVSQRRYCKSIYDCATLLQSLVSSVLDFSKIDAGLMILEVTPMSVRSVISGALKLLGPTAVDRGVVLAHEILRDIPPTLLGDPLRLQQIVINLVNNALKFCQGAARGGQVRVRVSRASPDGLPSTVEALAATRQCSLPANPCVISIEVDDNGPGVAPEVAARLFRPFTQADASTTRHFGGTGLGLSIVRGLAELMGGTATVSSPGELGGASFRCLAMLGVAQASQLERDAPTASAERSKRLTTAHALSRRVTPDTSRSSPAMKGVGLRGKRILVVDDIATNRLIAKRFLQALEATVDVAGDGKAGVDAVATADPPYHLVLMDCHMPVMDGFGAAAAIRALPDPSRARVPIVAVSASAQGADVDRSLAAGMDDHVAKPIDSATLAACATRWIYRAVAS